MRADHLASNRVNHNLQQLKYDSTSWEHTASVEQNPLAIVFLLSKTTRTTKTHPIPPISLALYTYNSMYRNHFLVDISIGCHVRTSINQHIALAQDSITAKAHLCSYKSMTWTRNHQDEHDHTSTWRRHRYLVGGGNLRCGGCSSAQTNLHVRRVVLWAFREALVCEYKARFRLAITHWQRNDN